MEQLRYFVKVLLATLAGLANINAQDHVFSLGNMHQLNINPATAGGDGNISFGMGYRWHWTGLSSRMQSNIAHIQGGCHKSRTGFGMQLYRSNYGDAFLTTTHFAGSMAIHLAGRTKNLTKRLHNKRYIVSFGLQLGVGQRSVDWGQLVFSDQLDPYKGYYTGQTQALFGSESSNISIDLSGGMRYKLRLNDKGSYLSAGLATFDLNRPVQSFLNAQNRLSIRFTAFTFSYFQLRKHVNNPKFLGVGWMMDSYAGISTHQLSASIDVSEYLMLGLGFRKRSLAPTLGYESVVVTFMYNIHDLAFGYSYDFTVSWFGIHNSQGSHEIGITYRLNTSLCGGGGGRSRQIDCYRLDRSLRGTPVTWRL